MKFSIINSDGNPVMQTASWQCVPSDDMLKSMRQMGYKFKIDGKSATLKSIQEMRNAG